jgi:hypothetical protein
VPEDSYPSPGQSSVPGPALGVHLISLHSYNHPGLVQLGPMLEAAPRGWSDPRLASGDPRASQFQAGLLPYSIP